MDLWLPTSPQLERHVDRSIRFRTTQLTLEAAEQPSGAAVMLESASAAFLRRRLRI